ncbi:tetratricopeptide repeat protein [Flavobacterium sp. GCM10023249]|uniref:tetratricopeptide repeat protein n=1 Tax=unclassified Flavobacterium TaxID=196869 RepID=UPI00361C25BE
MKNLLLIITFLLTTLIARSQEESQKAFSEGITLLKAEKYSEAEKHFSIAIQNGKTKNGLKMSYIYKAFSLNGQGNYDNAILCFNQAIKLDSIDPATYIDRAKSYSYLNNYDIAIKDYNKALELDPKGKSAEAAFYYLGRIKMLLHKNEESIHYFDKLLELVPTDFEIYFLRGTAKSNIMDVDGSIKDFDLAIHYNPDYKEAYANRGVQKINKIPASEKLNKKTDCFENPCADLLKAKKWGTITLTK